MIKITDENYNDALLHLQSIVERVVQIMELMQRGDIETAKAEMNELYIESVKSDARMYGSMVIQMIEHLLKLAYCDNYNDLERDARGWEVSIDKQRYDIIDDTNWGTPSQETNILHKLDYDMGGYYAKGVRRYINAASRNISLRQNKDLIPNECPWELKDLLDVKIITLVEMLPSETGYYRQYLLNHYPDDILNVDVE
jgi:hypothetical protein|nr:MAG TPA: protein of unknown function DUF29 [Caudoviricetes sp.]